MKKRELNKFKKEARREMGKSGEPALVQPRLKPETKRSMVVVAVALLAVIFLFSLLGWAGNLGKIIDRGLVLLFGWGRYAVPFILILLAYILYQPGKYAFRSTNYTGLVMFVLSYSGLIHLFAAPLTRAVTYISDGRGGGYAGLIFSFPLNKAMGPWAAGVIMLFFLVVSLQVMFDVSLKTLYERGNIFRRLAEKFREFFYRLRMNMDKTPAELPPDTQDAPTPEESGSNFSVKEIQTPETVPGQASVPSAADPAGQTKMFSLPKQKRKKVEIPLDLLESSNAKPTSGDIEANKEKIRKTLQNFGLEVEMGETKVGPTVTQFTLKPAEGVKLSQITTLSNDLALALAAHPIRIEAPIPGKSLVGVEVPNQTVAVVKLKELLSSREYKDKKTNLSIPLGKDVAGHVWLADLDPMPHLLIAGATGSGKSVCLNTILLSLLFQNSPDELKLVLVDPKRVEFTAYNDIPHLITPVINDINKTISALRWVVAEMDNRYQLLSKTGHRNIQSYNHDNGNIMPYLVVAIDELADLMSVAANEVEAAIIRLAQMARAVGIHLILATQRPSVDIITGLIKANITSRIAFSVASLVDSRTILDNSGAEKLLGRGDMLYMSAHLSKPKRLQGAFVTDQEITRVLDYIKKTGQPEYRDDVTVKVVDKTLSGGFDDMEDDGLLEQAKELVIKTGKASASFLQRRLRVGYARAARLLDMMEEQGIVGPGDGAKPREILVSREAVGIPVPNSQIGEPELEDDTDQTEADDGDDDESGGEPDQNNV